ncbi:uncharacterized protein [Drosophila pseudoobscura]|uniref:Uncharacterized protein n=1 Tax=Drosophila pseudoobscura pseudoobscura TaxID=46245 RepID=A0A6I8W302_DROPS|nr:uncharacterized protein LOC117184435 [Drosophila pseudoobscura]
MKPKRQSCEGSCSQALLENTQRMTRLEKRLEAMMSLLTSLIQSQAVTATPAVPVTSGNPPTIAAATVAAPAPQPPQETLGPTPAATPETDPETDEENDDDEMWTDDDSMDDIKAYARNMRYLLDNQISWNAVY